MYGGQVNVIAVEPESGSVIYAGSWGGDGLFKSSDNGATWQAIPTENPSWFRNWEIYDLALDPNNQGTVWVAYNHYIDVSFDDGTTWQTCFFASNENRFCYAVKVDLHDESGNTVYVGTGGPDNTDESGTIFKTTDGGKTWFKTYLTENFEHWDFTADFNIWDLALDPLQPLVVWAASRKSGLSPDGQIYLSPDGGEGTWWYWNIGFYDSANIWNGAYVDEILVHPTETTTIFAAAQYGVVRKQADEGWYWLEPNESCRAICIPAGRPDTLYAGLIDQTAVSTDRGETWDYFASPGEFLSLDADPLQPDIIYGGNLNRGIFKSLNGAQSWQAINKGIHANSIFATDLSSGDSAVMLAGTLAGVYRNTDNLEWEQINEFQSEAVSFHPQNEAILYAGFDWQIGKSTDAGRTWSYKDLSEQSDSHKVAAIAVSAQAPELVFAGISFSSGQKGEIIKSTDSGETFTLIKDFPTPVNTVSIHPNNPQLIFAGTGSFYAPVAAGGLCQSTDGGTTWQLTSLQNVVVNAVAFTSSDSNLIYVGSGASDTSYAGIFCSTDTGQTWAQKIKGLPDSFAVADIKIDSSNSNVVYAALYKGFSDEMSNLGGIYVSLDGGDYWTQIGLSDYRLYDINSSMSPSVGATHCKPVNAQFMPSLPDSTIIAGTASGLYQTTTAGNGILTGLITSAETAAPIDAANLSTTFGNNCRSADGYYMLLLPTGVHTIQAQAAGYYATTIPGIIVSAGQSVLRDITLSPLEDNNNTGCLATALLKGPAYQNELYLLQKFRDTVLGRTKRGRHLIDLYYNTSNKVWRLLQTHPHLQARCLQLMENVMPIVISSLTDKSLSIPATLLNELSSLLFDLEQVSPRDLQRTINRFRSQMREPLRY